MSKPVIAIDIDDVLGNEHKAILEFVEERYHLTHTRDSLSPEKDHPTYWQKLWGGAEVADQRYAEYVEAGRKANHEPLEGSIETLTKLKQNYRLVILTLRGDRHVDYTHEWLVKHFPDIFDQVEFLPLWGDRRVITKAHIAKEIGADYLIDDNIEHCILAAEKGVKALLFGNHNWNKLFQPKPGITKVANWAAVLEYFNEERHGKFQK